MKLNPSHKSAEGDFICEADFINQRLIYPVCKTDLVEKRHPLDVFFLEAPPRFELGNKAFAELCLTTWLWRHIKFVKTKDALKVRLSSFVFWSGRRDSNSRRSPWQGDALPLSHSRIITFYSAPSKSVNGASGRNRTTDTRIFSPLLYRLSYRGK